MTISDVVVPRARSLIHKIRGHIEIQIGGYNASIRCESAFLMECTLRNAYSERPWLLDLLSNVQDEVYLDVGAGYGTEAILAAKAGAKRCIAVEADATRAEYTKRNAEENGVEIDVLELTAGKGQEGTASLADIAIDASVMKIDIEGGEIPALRGMGDALSNFNRVYVEVHPRDAVGGDRIDTTYQLLNRFGFEVREVDMRPEGQEVHLIGFRE